MKLQRFFNVKERKNTGIITVFSLLILYRPLKEPQKQESRRMFSSAVLSKSHFLFRGVIQKLSTGDLSWNNGSELCSLLVINISFHRTLPYNTPDFTDRREEQKVFSMV